LVGLLVFETYCAPKRALVVHTVPDWEVVAGMGLESPEGVSSSERDAFDRGWRALREGRLDVAYSEIEGLSQKYPKEPTIQTANGFLDLRLGSADAASRRFQTALAAEPSFGPAESGYFLVALSLGDEEAALDRLNRLQRNYPQHPLVDRYGTTLRVNVAESRLTTARELKRAGRYEEAAAAYLRALEVAPEAGALYLEAAEAELAAGFPERSVVHALRATELEPMNAEAFRLLGEARYENRDLAGAASALERAAALGPGDPELRARAAAVGAELRETTLPAEYLDIGDERRITREQLAALLAVELKGALDRAPIVESSVIATDIADSWAQAFIRRTVGVGVLEVFPNHMFQPKAFVSRMDLARSLVRALQVLSPEVYQEARAPSSTVAFTDLSPEASSYPAAALAVSFGLMERGEEGAFESQRLVTGTEAAASVGALALHVTP
jgi:tetratricopeptide (TPR) repeat protein